MKPSIRIREIQFKMLQEFHGKKSMTYNTNQFRSEAIEKYLDEQHEANKTPERRPVKVVYRDDSPIMIDGGLGCKTMNSIL